MRTQIPSDAVLTRSLPYGHQMVELSFASPNRASVVYSGSDVVPFLGSTRKLAPLKRRLRTLPARSSGL